MCAQVNRAHAGPAPQLSKPDAACASCHEDIYERYRQTPMAHASGPAAEGFIPADFVHAASGVHYRVTEDDGRVWLNFARDAGTGGALEGKRELRYFIGSGRRGRTFLFQQEGYWFEAPINWYGKKQLWDMAPNFLDARQMPLTLPVDPGCLRCHASNVAHALPDARNHYADAPFATGGITCEACHGDGSAHVASGGKTPMLKLDELPPERRNSVCLQCHLEGQAVVVREGKRLEDFRAGDDLFDYALFFVYRNGTGSEGRAVSQWEALLKSECMRKSPGMTCTTCHDPHGSPPPSERVEFYRQRCLQCHNRGKFAQEHHPENRDCTECHMARLPSNDIAHEQVTDHWIRKRVSGERLPLATSGELVTVGGLRTSNRALGLAYAQMAVRGDQSAGERAMDLLRRAERDANGAPQDHELHAQLAFLEQVDGQPGTAAREYRQALASDPDDGQAAGDLALVEAGEGHTAEAMRLLGEVFNHDPAQSVAGMNLAILDCSEGKGNAALETLARLIEFDPDNAKAQAFSEEIRTGRHACAGK